MVKNKPASYLYVFHIGVLIDSYESATGMCCSAVGYTRRLLQGGSWGQMKYEPDNVPK